MVCNRYYLFSLLVLLGACDLIDYHPYDGKIDAERNMNKKNIQRIEALCHEKDTVRFAMMGDSQRSYDETETFVKRINQRHDIDFVIHGGDMADFGMTKEFELMTDIMSKLNVPYVALIGNHDIIGNGESAYKAIYGDLNFSFIAGNTKFVCLNTNAIEYDYSVPVPDFNFIKGELLDSTSVYSRTVVAMHAPPENEQFNNNVKDIFQEYIKRFPSLQFCLHAHTHHVSINDFFDDGILYYGCDNMAKRSYLVFTMLPEGYTYEVVQF